MPESSIKISKKNCWNLKQRCKISYIIKSSIVELIETIAIELELVYEEEFSYILRLDNLLIMNNQLHDY